ncbi:hypothetical protein [Streptomyces sp. NPDC093707]|uniref:hypothetical protein n=1 Tax=Streptomyces sp. NPDC093707 TaxID=3154984 RepID=UPI00345010D1
MDLTQQYLLDSYRAAQRGEAAPPAPGAATVRTAREIRQWRRFQAVVTDPAERWWGRNGRLARRTATLLARYLRPLDAQGGPAPTRSRPAAPSPLTVRAHTTRARDAQERTPR